MSRFDQPALRIALSLAILAVAFLGFADSVRADSIVVNGDTIAAGTVVENDAIILGEDVVIDGTVHGDVFAFGNTVVINGTVDGSLVSVSSSLTVNGSVSGTVYVLAGTLTLGPTATTERNVLVASFRLVTESGSVVGRDLHAISVGGQLSGNIGRDLNATIGILEIIDVIRDSLSRGNGASAGIDTVFRLANIDSASQPKGTSEAEGVRVDVDTVSNWIIGRVQELLLLLVVAGLFLWLKPSLFHQTVERVRRTAFPAAGYGLIAYVSGFVGAVLLAIALVFVSIALTIAVSWRLALLVWALGSSSLFLAFFSFVMFVYYISKVIVSFVVGKMILRLVVPRHSDNTFAALLLGLVLYVLLVPIPVIGWLMAFVMSLLGLGATWLVVLDRRRAAKEALRRRDARADEFAPATAGETGQGDAIEIVAAADAALIEAKQVGEKLAQDDIEAKVEVMARCIGPWRFNESMGMPAQSSIDAAALADTDVLAPIKEHALSFLATVDSDGNPLRGGSDYVVIGSTLDARWWNLTAYDPDHLIVNENAKYSVSMTTVTTGEDGSWSVRLTPRPRDDEDWIHSGSADCDLALVLRLYGPAPNVLDKLGVAALPEILSFDPQPDVALDASEGDDATEGDDEVEGGLADE